MRGDTCTAGAAGVAVTTALTAVIDGMTLVGPATVNYYLLITANLQDALTAQIWLAGSAMPLRGPSRVLLSLQSHNAEVPPRSRS